MSMSGYDITLVSFQQFGIKLCNAVNNINKKKIVVVHKNYLLSTH